MAAWQAFERLTKLGFPRRFQVVQFPNLPLIIALSAGRASHYAVGTAQGYLQVTAYLAMATWAYEEIVSGSNWFRRLLGTFFMVAVLLRIAHH